MALPAGRGWRRRLANNDGVEVRVSREAILPLSLSLPLSAAHRCHPVTVTHSYPWSSMFLGGQRAFHSETVTVDGQMDARERVSGMERCI